MLEFYMIFYTSNELRGAFNTEVFSLIIRSHCGTISIITISPFKTHFTISQKQPKSKTRMSMIYTYVSRLILENHFRRNSHGTNIDFTPKKRTYSLNFVFIWWRWIKVFYFYSKNSKWHAFFKISEPIV